jgi:hypothetical protein
MFSQYTAEGTVNHWHLPDHVVLLNFSSAAGLYAMNCVHILLFRHTSCLLFTTSSVILSQFDVTSFSLPYRLRSSWSNILASGSSLKFHFRNQRFFPSIFLTTHASLSRVNTGLQLKIVFLTWGLTYFRIAVGSNASLSASVHSDHKHRV